jgi:hypothetical protein
MASNSLLVPVRSANTEDACNVHSTTRRAIFGTIALGAVAIAANVTPVAAVTRSYAETVSPELSALIAAYDAANAKADTYYQTVYIPARERMTTLQAGVPHYEFVGGPSVVGNPINYSTADRKVLAMSKAISKNDAFAGTDMRADSRRLIAASLRRDRRLAAIRRESGIAEAGNQCDALGDACANACLYVCDFPVSTIADLNAKMAFVMRTGAYDTEGTVQTLAADIARLAAREA